MYNDSMFFVMFILNVKLFLIFSFFVIEYFLNVFVSYFIIISSINVIVIFIVRYISSFCVRGISFIKVFMLFLFFEYIKFF